MLQLDPHSVITKDTHNKAVKKGLHRRDFSVNFEKKVKELCEPRCPAEAALLGALV